MTRRTESTAPIFLDRPARKPRSALVEGPASVVPAVLRRIGCSWQWDHNLRGYLIPIQRLPDVEAVLTLDRRHVEYRPAALM